MESREKCLRKFDTFQLRNSRFLSASSPSIHPLDIVMNIILINFILIILQLVTSHGSVIFEPKDIRKELNRDKRFKFSSNDLAHVLLRLCPTVNCFGYDCFLVTESNGCKTCACPFGSPARGCDRLPYEVWLELVLNGCPNLVRDGGGTRYTAQKIARWFRHVDKEKGIDECRSYIYPYCYKSDYNLWRSPRTRDECMNLCYKVPIESTTHQNTTFILTGLSNGTHYDDYEDYSLRNNTNSE